MIIESSAKKLVLLLFRDFSKTHTVTSLAEELKMSRIGIWKILKRLQSENFIKLISAGSKKTSAFIININLDNVIVDKTLALYLTEEAIRQKRWRSNFSDLENIADFIILFGSALYSSQKANDIDIIIVSQKRKFIKIQKIIDRVQKTEMKKIHNINFTEAEFIIELKKHNKAVFDAVERGVILFGQEKFIKFMKRYKK
ncbi:MAG TPA: hypothetical protein ENG87_04195 [Candidatus Pacearchaeota archaeon]|nr:hypothetical protein [Candidatus Pacearchaeota archaeon]HDZ60216.1 hypothetical protein [Candidatus Pacearchaeota archaeon]